MQPEPPGPALLDRQVDVRVGRLRDVEALDIIIGQRHFDAPGDRGHVDAHLGVARRAVLDHVREQLLQRQVDGGQEPGVDPVPGEEIAR